MADGFFPTLVSKDENANAQTNPLWTRLSDGTTAVTFTGSSLNVNVTGGATNVQFAEDSAHTSGDVGTAALAVRQDTLAASTSADGDYANLKVTAAGALYVSQVGTVTVSATDLDIRDLTHVSDSVKVGDGTDFLAVNADGSINITDNGGSLTVDGTVTVTATDLDIRDLTLAQDSVKISANTSANSATNPIFVQLTNNAITGEIHDYNTATVAGGATSNHDYTVVTALKLKAIEFSCSGGGKVELQVGPVASLVSKWVGFVPKAGGVVQLKLDPAIEVPTTGTGTVRLIRTNREGASQDLYSTIIGIDA